MQSTIPKGDPNLRDAAVTHFDSLCISENMQIGLQDEKVQLPSERQVPRGVSLVIRNKQNEIDDWKDGTQKSQNEYYY